MFEKVLRFFIDNSRTNYTLFVLVFAVGIVSYIKTPKEIFPVFDLDMISVSGSYTGASIDTLNKIIVTDLEDDLKSVQGIKDITSIVNPSRFSIILELKKGTNKYNTVSQVKDIVSISKSNLPSDMQEPIVKTIELKKSLLEITISSDNKNIDLIKKANNIKTKILNIKNISEVIIYGDSDKFYEIKIDEKKLEAYGINQLDLYRSLKNISYIFPLGRIQSNNKHYYLSTYNGAKNIKELQNTQIKIASRSIYLKDIAVLSKKYEDTSTIFSLDNKNAINIILKQSVKGDATVLEKKVTQLLKTVNISDDLKYTIRNDRSTRIKDRLNIVISNIILGIIIITLIVALLINMRMAFIIMVGVSSLIFFPTGQAVIFQPMAIALGFGLAWGTVLNLIFLPVLYSFANRLKL